MSLSGLACVGPIGAKKKTTALVADSARVGNWAQGARRGRGYTSRLAEREGRAMITDDAYSTPSIPTY